ncbi:MAG TPA: hypothetical protein VK179_15695 [Bacteroidales bacterium]|nr:hypothetical protein [Bacteroidales bacterium]
MDEAFIPLSKMIESIIDINGEIYTDDQGIHSYIYAFDVSTPIELDVFTDENGKIRIGSVPPIYRVPTTFRPLYHSISLNMKKINDTDGN